MQNNHLLSLPDVLAQLPLRRLEITGNPGLILPDPLRLFATFSQRTSHLQGHHLPLSQAIKDWYSVQDSSHTYCDIIAHWEQFDGEDNAANFTMLLHSFSRKIEQYTALNKSYAYQRINHILQAMANDATLRQQCFSLAFESTATCEDRLLLTINNIEIVCLVQQTPQDLPALLTLGRALFRLDCLEKFVQQDLQSRSLTFQEPLEVTLFYRYALSDALALPSPVTHMAFSNLAEVTKQQLKRATQSVLEQEKDLHSLADFMCTLDFWQAYVQKCHQRVFRSIDMNSHHQLDALDRQGLNEQLYLEQSNAIHTNRKVNIKYYLNTLTLEIIKNS